MIDTKHANEVLAEITKANAKGEWMLNECRRIEVSIKANADKARADLLETQRLRREIDERWFHWPSAHIGAAFG